MAYNANHLLVVLATEIICWFTFIICSSTQVTSSMASSHLLSPAPFPLASSPFLHQTSTRRTMKMPLPPGLQMEFQLQLLDPFNGIWFSSTPHSDSYIALHQLHHDSPRALKS